jgi:putative membrane protein
MVMGELFSDDIRKEAAAVVKEIEGQSSAEIVLTARQSSAAYRETDYLFGFGIAVITLGALLYLPQEFALEWMVVDVVVGFLLGSVVAAYFPSLRRWLVGRKRMSFNVSRAARAAFVDLGVTRTSGRTGILVYLSAYERMVHVVADIGIAAAKPGKAYEDALARISAALVHGFNRSRLFDALRALGPALAPALPRAADDVNELPDEMSTDKDGKEELA